MGLPSPLGQVGQGVFQQNDTASAQVDAKAVVEAVAKLNHVNVVGPENEIVVTVSGHRMTIEVVNRETHDVVQQISPPSIFRMLRKLSAV